jgi:hypothetical protein
VPRKKTLIALEPAFSQPDYSSVNKSEIITVCDADYIGNTNSPHLTLAATFSYFYLKPTSFFHKNVSKIQLHCEVAIDDIYIRDIDILACQSAIALGIVNPEYEIIFAVVRAVVINQPALLCKRRPDWSRVGSLN